MGVFEELRDFFSKEDDANNENAKSNKVGEDAANQAIFFSLLSGQKKHIFDSSKLHNQAINVAEKTDKKENLIAKGEVVFIDGGNSEIIGASTFSLQFMRIASVIYSGIQRKGIIKKDFFCLSMINDENSIKLKLESVSSQDSRKNNSSQNSSQTSKQKYGATTEKFSELKLDLSDIKLKRDDEKIYGVETSSRKAINIARRLFELKEVLVRVSENSEEVSVIVLDGALDYATDTEKKLIQKIRLAALEKNIVVVGISKISTAYAENGKPINMYLDEKAESKNISVPWFYEGILLNSETNTWTGFVKLSKSKQNFVFRFDYFAEQKELLKNSETFKILAVQATDAVFAGYPYGLVEVDEEARITNEEIGEAYAQLMIISGDKWGELQKASASVSAHSILDSIKF